MTDFGWVDFCFGSRQEPSFGSCHLQAVVSELDRVVKDVEYLKEQVASAHQPEVEGKLRSMVESELSCCLRRCEELHLRWQQEMSKFTEELRELKVEELAELRSIIGTHATRLSTLDSDMQVLRQMAPVHGASLKATEAAVQLLRESTERSIDGIRQDIAMDQKRRAYQEERMADQQKEAEEALELVNTELTALKKASRQTNAALSQLKEAVPDTLALSRDVESLKREGEKQAAKIVSLARSMSIFQEQQEPRERELEQIRSDVNAIKDALQQISNRETDLTRCPEFQQLRSEVSVVAEQVGFRREQEQSTAKLPEEVAGVRAELQRLKAEVDHIKGAKLRLLQTSELAASGLMELGKSVDNVQHQINVLFSKQSRMKNAIEQIGNGLARHAGDSAPQVCARLSVPVNSSSDSTPCFSRKLLVQPNLPDGLTAIRNRRGTVQVPQVTSQHSEEECTSNESVSAVHASAAAAASAALSIVVAGAAEHARTLQTAELKPLLTAHRKVDQQTTSWMAPKVRTPSTPPAFTRPTLQSPNNRSPASRRHTSAGAPFQQSEELQLQDQQQLQVDLSQKRRVNNGHNISQQAPGFDSCSGKAEGTTPLTGTPSLSNPLPPSALRSARTTPSPTSHAARVSFRDPPESSTRSISSEEPEEKGASTGAAEIVSVESALLSDFSSAFVGRSLGGSRAQRRSYTVSADQAIETLKSFFFLGNTGAALNTHIPSGALPQWPQPAKPQQETQGVEEHMPNLQKTSSRDQFSKVLATDKDKEARTDSQIEDGSASIVPVSYSCSSSTTTSNSLPPGESSAQSSHASSPIATHSQKSYPFLLENIGESNDAPSGSVEEACSDIQSHFTRGSSPGLSGGTISQASLAASADLRN